MSIKIAIRRNWRRPRLQVWGAMAKPLTLDSDRLFPAEPTVRSIARELYASVKDLPIVSPHGHTDPAWFATDAPWTNATELLLSPDHYLYRMLYSQGVALDALGVADRSGVASADACEAWRLFASHFFLFRGTPSRLWLDHVFATVFGIEVSLDASTADTYFERINAALSTPEFRPRALFDRFNIELLATTEGADDRLEHHRAIRQSGWRGRVITTYRPDSVVDPEHEDFAVAMSRFGEISGEDVTSWDGYLAAHRKRRADFRAAGATATDHGHPTPRTADLPNAQKRALFARIVGGSWSGEDAELFRAQMLVEMAAMSLDDGMVMQIHPGSFRNHNRWLHQHYGRDKGADIPQRVDYVHALKPLLDRFGNEPRLSI